MKPRLYALLLAGAMCFSISSPRSAVPTVRAAPAYLRHVRAIETADLGILSPAGLAYSPAANVFFVRDDLKPGQAAGGPAEIVMFTPLEDPAGRIHVAAGFTDPLNLAFDARIGRLVLFDETAG